VIRTLHITKTAEQALSQQHCTRHFSRRWLTELLTFRQLCGHVVGGCYQPHNFSYRIGGDDFYDLKSDEDFNNDSKINLKVFFNMPSHSKGEFQVCFAC